MYIFRIVVRTMILLLALSFVYLIVYILPGILTKREINRAEKIIYTKYFYLSQNRSLQTQYLSLKSISMSFASEKDTYLTKIDESAENVRNGLKNPYKRGFTILAGKETVLNLEYFEKQDRDLTDRSEDVLKRQSSEIEKVKKINSVLNNFYAYDIAVDLGGFDVNQDEDRELIIQRVTAANKGLLTVSQKLTNLGKEGWLDGGYVKLSEDIEKLARDFSAMENAINNKNYVSYTSLLNNSIDRYETIRVDAFTFERKLFTQDSFVRMFADEKDIIQKYESILTKINEMQRDN